MFTQQKELTRLMGELSSQRSFPKDALDDARVELKRINTCNEQAKLHYTPPSCLNIGDERNENRVPPDVLEYAMKSAQALRDAIANI